MRRMIRAVAGAVVLAAVTAGPGWAQAPAPAPPEPAQGQPKGPVELRSLIPEPFRGLQVVTPGPTARELTRPRDLDFYAEDQRIPHNPAFLEPFTTTTPSGSAKMGVSAYTAPQTPLGPLSGVNPLVNMGSLSIGFTVIWDLLPPEAAPTAPPR